MNINNVYIAKIYVKKNENEKADYGKGVILTYGEGVFIKDALVYEDIESYNPRYIDLETGKEYVRFDVCDAHMGELYINLQAGLIPYTDLIENNKKNMSKRKILKKYNDYVENTNEIMI